MSVYIKGMEMPTSCDKCSYSAWSNFYQIYVCNAVRKNEPVLFDGKQTKSTAVARSARADNCPLVSVPPHGEILRVLKTERECVGRDCDRDCGKCDLSLERSEILKAYNALIAMLDPADKEGEG